MLAVHPRRDVGSERAARPRLSLAVAALFCRRSRRARPRHHRPMGLWRRGVAHRVKLLQQGHSLCRTQPPMRGVAHLLLRRLGAGYCRRGCRSVRRGSRPASALYCCSCRCFHCRCVPSVPCCCCCRAATRRRPASPPEPAGRAAAAAAPGGMDRQDAAVAPKLVVGAAIGDRPVDGRWGACTYVGECGWAATGVRGRRGDRSRTCRELTDIQNDPL